jgi:TonB family protein
MKTVVTLFLFIFSGLSMQITAQNSSVPADIDTNICVAHDTAVKIIVDRNARFQDGDILKFRDHVMRNIQMPLIAMQNRYQGKATIKFVVDWDGQVKNVSVLKSSGYKILDNEAIRVIKNSPPWSSAKINNICVPQQFFIPIEFRNLGVINDSF